MCLVQFLESPFGQSIATLVGSFIGVIGGFLVNRCISWMDRRKRRRDLLTALVENLKLSKEDVEEKLKHVEENNVVPLEYLSALTLESTVSLRYEVMDDVNGNVLLDSILQLIRELNGKIDIGRPSLEARRLLLGVFINLMPKLLEKLEEAILWIEDELKVKKKVKDE